MNKEVQDALHCLLNIALENDKYESQKEQFKIVNDYIKNLEQRIYKAVKILNEEVPDEEVGNYQFYESQIYLALLILGSDKE